MIQGKSFSIRPVQPDEMDAILQVYRQCEDFLALGPVATASMSMVLADLDLSKQAGGQFCGIYDQETGLMMGVVDYVASGYRGKLEVAYLTLLMIAAPYRNNGLGAEVVRRVEEEICREGRVNVIKAGVQINNPGAIRFWQRMGYRIVSGAQAQPDGTVAYQLEKTLNRSE